MTSIVSIKCYSTKCQSLSNWGIIIIWCKENNVWLCNNIPNQTCDETFWQYLPKRNHPKKIFRNFGEVIDPKDMSEPPTLTHWLSLRKNLLFGHSRNALRFPAKWKNTQSKKLFSVDIIRILDFQIFRCAWKDNRSQGHNVL